VIDERVKQLLTDRYDSKIRGRVAEIAAELGWPAWAVKKAASKLGLARPWSKDRRNWTPAEEAFLRRWQGARSAGWIARQLGRGETSVVLKFRRLGLSRRVRVGYTSRDLGLCMGVDQATVCGWIERGLLAARRRGSSHPADWYQIEPVAILRFLREHRWQYRLDKVDQDWFLEFVFSALPAETREAVESADRQLELVESDGAMRREPPHVYLPTPERIRREAEKLRERQFRRAGLSRDPRDAENAGLRSLSSFASLEPQGATS
jgi:hypothetical protein